MELAELTAIRRPDFAMAARVLATRWSVAPESAVQAMGLGVVGLVSMEASGAQSGVETMVDSSRRNNFALAPLA